MTKKSKYLWLYFLLSMLPTLPVGILMLAYQENKLLVDILYYGLCFVTFAFKFTRFCPFKIISKYVVYTKGLNFWQYWAKAYGNRNGLAILTYGSYTFFLFVLFILLI
jgi:hypothetical protein